MILPILSGLGHLFSFYPENDIWGELHRSESSGKLRGAPNNMPDLKMSQALSVSVSSACMCFSLDLVNMLML